MQTCDQLLCGDLRYNTHIMHCSTQAHATTHKACIATHKPMPQRHLPASFELFLGHIHGDFHIVNEFANEFVVVLVVQVF